MILTLKVKVAGASVGLNSNDFEDPENISENDKIDLATEELHEVFDIHGDLNDALEDIGGTIDDISVEDVEFEEDEEITIDWE